jgi:hypothetical protein
MRCERLLKVAIYIEPYSLWLTPPDLNWFSADLSSLRALSKKVWFTLDVMTQSYGVIGVTRNNIAHHPNIVKHFRLLEQ